MLARLLGITGRDRAEHHPATLPPEALTFAPMVPLHPPAAQNDDGMRRVYDAVEQALREAGHLPRDTAPEA